MKADKIYLFFGIAVGLLMGAVLLNSVLLVTNWKMQVRLMRLEQACVQAGWDVSKLEGQ
jgi:hypothetical protein